MALIRPTSMGLTRTWELASTAIAGDGVSDTAEWGLSSIIGSMYILTSSTPLMTVQVQESPDNATWVTVEEIILAKDEVFRISHPFWWMRVSVSAHSSGQIDNIKIVGIVQ